MRSHLSQAQCERQVERWWKDEGMMVVRMMVGMVVHIDEVKMAMVVGG